MTYTLLQISIQHVLETAWVGLLWQHTSYWL
jgi:hypothetical protein